MPDPLLALTAFSVALLVSTIGGIGGVLLIDAIKARRDDQDT